MTPYRQAIWPGDVGSDVLAVKRAMIAMGATGAGALIVTGPARKRAGVTFVAVLRGVQRRSGLVSDGRYGPDTHKIIAPHFDAWGVVLYRSAAIRSRVPPAPPIWQETAKQAAQALLRHQQDGSYRADNPGDLHDLQETAAGRPVWSQLGRYVYISPQPFEIVQWLIEVGGYKIGTFAFCSDHADDGALGHAGGHAVDISSIDGEGIVGPGMHDRTLAVAKACRAAPKTPWQLICAGAGNVYYSDILALCIPNASFYGWPTLAGHRNHIHCGY